MMTFPIPRRFAVAALALAVTAGAQAATYRIVDFGNDRFPEMINNRGDIAGAATGTEFRAPHAAVYRGGDWKALMASRNRSSVGRAINARGDVVGSISDGIYQPRPTLWKRGSERLLLTLPNGATVGSANDISDDRVVVGYFELAGTQTAHCFRWSQADGAVEFGTTGGIQSCWALSINRAGQIVGAATVHPDDPSTGRAFRYVNGAFQDLGTLGSGEHSTAYEINNKGQVVGVSTIEPGEAAVGHAFLWSDGAMKDIGASPDFWYTYAMSINDRGDIVGVGISLVDHDYHALRFANGQVIALETEVEDLGDWKLRDAYSVNEAGVIVGDGQRADGTHGFMLVPIATH